MCTTSYSTTNFELLQYNCFMVLCIFELWQVICQKSPILTYPTRIWHPDRVTCLNFAKIFSIRKLESLGYHAVLFA